MVSPPYKLVLLGDSSVGKTSLVQRFTTEHFDPFTSNTIGAAFITKEFSSINNSSKKVKFEIWDTAGQERYRSLTPMYYRNAKIALLCYDLSNIEESFEKSKFWIDQLRINDTSVDTKNIKIKLVGTKSDLLDAPARSSTTGEPGSEPADSTSAESEPAASKTVTEPSDTTNEELDAVNTYCLQNDVTHHITSAKLGQGIPELFSSIIDEIEDSFWDHFSRAQEEEDSARNGSSVGTIDFLNARFRGSETATSCCS